MAVLRSGAGSNAKNVVLGIYDRSERRTCVNEEKFALRAHARKQAVLYSQMSIIVLPVAFLLFVAPGFVWLWCSRSRGRPSASTRHRKSFASPLPP